MTTSSVARPMGPPPRIVSLQVGLPREYGSPGAPDPENRAWTSGITKEPVTGPRWVGGTHIEGDAQADLKHHGGPDKAVLAYAAAHYAAWRTELPHIELAPGAFGENLTIEGLSEEGVSVGDVWVVGTATLQVSQPRQPCWKLARRLRVPDMVARVQATLRTGWYLRVLEEGEIRPGVALSIVARPHPEWTVAEASRVMQGVRADPTTALELAALPALSAGWKRTLRLRASGNSVDTAARILGPEA